jgi:hypothetical protein
MKSARLVIAMIKPMLNVRRVPRLDRRRERRNLFWEGGLFFLVISGALEWKGRIGFYYTVVPCLEKQMDFLESGIFYENS